MQPALAAALVPAAALPSQEPQPVRPGLMAACSAAVGWLARHHRCRCCPDCRRPCHRRDGEAGSFILSQATCVPASHQGHHGSACHAEPDFEGAQPGHHAPRSAGMMAAASQQGLVIPELPEQMPGTPSSSTSAGTGTGSEALPEPASLDLLGFCVLGIVAARKLGGRAGAGRDLRLPSPCCSQAGRQAEPDQQQEEGSFRAVGAELRPLPLSRHTIQSRVGHGGVGEVGERDAAPRQRNPGSQALPSRRQRHQRRLTAAPNWTSLVRAPGPRRPPSSAAEGVLPCCVGKPVQGRNSDILAHYTGLPADRTQPRLVARPSCTGRATTSRLEEQPTQVVTNV